MYLVAVRNCPPLQAPMNGDVFVLGTTVNSSATYRCRAGFQLVGLVRRICQSNGEWSGEDTQCLCEGWIMVARECKKMAAGKLGLHYLPLSPLFSCLLAIFFLPTFLFRLLSAGRCNVPPVGLSH